MLMLPAIAMADVICLTSGKEIKAKVVTVGEKEITYKKADNPDGPNYVVPSETVFYIEFDNGQREVVTPQDGNRTTTTSQQQNVVTSPTATPSGNTLLGVLTNTTGGMEVDEEARKPNMFPDMGFMPRVTVGYQGTSSESGSINYDWEGLYAEIAAMYMMSMGRTSAWSAGVSFTWLQGDIKAYSGKKPSKKDWPMLNATYVGIPIWYWWKSEYFMLGTGINIDFLIHTSMDGKKVKDALNEFRAPWKIYGGCSLGIFDIGLQVGFDFTSGFKGDGMSWSPTITVGGTVGVRLGKIKKKR